MPNCVWERWHSLDVVDLRKVLMMGSGKFRSTLLYPSTRTRSYVIRTSFFRTTRLLFFKVLHGRKSRVYSTLKKGGTVEDKGPPYNVCLRAYYCTHHYTYNYCTLHYARVAHAIGLMIAESLIKLAGDNVISVLVLNT